MTCFLRLALRSASGCLWFEHLRSRAGCKFGDSENPLLVAVRAGARAIMPGMMDTVLNVGLNAKTVEAHRVTKNDKHTHTYTYIYTYIYIYLYLYVYIYIYVCM